MQNPTPAQLTAQIALRAQAKHTAGALIKQRARAYAKHPMALENVFPGLAAAEPEAMRAVALHLVERARLTPQRWFGFGGEISILNAKAVLLLARVQRRSARARARKAAPSF